MKLFSNIKKQIAKKMVPKYEPDADDEKIIESMFNKKRNSRRYTSSRPDVFKMKSKLYRKGSDGSYEDIPQRKAIAEKYRKMFPNKD